MVQDRKVVLMPKEFVQIGGTDYSLISNYIPQVFTLALMVSTFHCEECPHDVTVSNPGFKYLGSNSVVPQPGPLLGASIDQQEFTKDQTYKLATVPTFSFYLLEWLQSISHLVLILSKEQHRNWMRCILNPHF